MLKNPKFYKWLGFALFACSAIITMMYEWTTAVGFLPTLIVLVQGTAIESCKTGFSYVAIAIQGFWWKLLFGSLAFFAFCFSVTFTFGFNVNMANRVHNNNLYNSDDYSKQQDDTKRQKDLYDQTKKDIDDLKSQRDNQVSEMKAAKDQLPKNYKSQRVIEQDKINAATDDYNSKIESKQQELNKISDNLKNVVSQELPTDGYQTMFELIAKTINNFATRGNTSIRAARGKVDVKYWDNIDI